MTDDADVGPCVGGGRLVAATGVEDNPARMRQLGLPA
jgi:hypothetical protein